MSRSYVKFAGLNIMLAEGWCDITDDLPSKTPFSLAKPQGGIGVIQISAATYKTGSRPRIDIKQLEDMLKEFLDNNGLEHVQNIQIQDGEVSHVSTDIVSDNEFIRVWYVTDGSSVALITYLSGEPNAPSLKYELLDANAMIQSLQF